MKAYHVHLMRAARSSDRPLSRNCYHEWSADPATLIDQRRFELLTQMYSCINHKTKNPDIPLVLITDENTLKYYDRWQLTGLYDEVITNFHDDYPLDRIAEGFWASPKIWAMKKLHAPFIIFDTDLVLHQPLSTYNDCDLLYLHRDTPAIYPNPLDIAGPSGFRWDAETLRSFAGSLPMTSAVVGMFNEGFKQDYVNRYFDFVLDAPGDLLNPSQNAHLADLLGLDVEGPSAQIVMEQWLLAALALKWKKYDNNSLRTRAVVKALWLWDEFSPLDVDQDPSTINDELSNNFYRLWGAQVLQNCISIQPERYVQVRDTLLGARFIVEESPQFPVVKDVYEQIIAGLTDDRAVGQDNEDLVTVFDSIYESGRWGRGGSYEGTSGSGSSLKNSEVYLAYLQGFLRERKIESVVDAGCGDWQVSRFVDWGDASYVGYDASHMVIAKNAKAYSKYGVEFVHGNFLNIDLPGADLLIVKDVLQHLSNRNVHQAIRQFKKYKYVIIVNDIEPETLSALNIDIRDGDYRTLDITVEPFSVHGTKVLTYALPHSREVKHVILVEN